MPATAHPATNENLLSIMEKQNDGSMLVHQQSLLSLPKTEIPVFDGNHLRFHAFMRSSEQVIQTKSGKADDCLQCLAQYTRGQPNELVQSSQHLSQDAGYVKADSAV